MHGKIFEFLLVHFEPVIFCTPTVSYLDAGYLKNPPKSFTHLGPVNPPRVLKPVLSQELDERNPISVHASTAPAISTATALSNSQVNSQILSGMNVKIDSIMRGIQDVIVPISSVGTKLSDGSDKLDLLIVTCGKMSDSLGELLFIVKQSQQQLTDLVCTSQASKTALISQETQTQPPSPNMKNGMPGMQGPNLKALTLSESAIPIVKASELVDTSQVRIPPANRSKRPEAEVLGQGDMDLQPSMNQRNIRPRISSDPESLVPRMNQMVQQQAAVSDTRPGVASALRARSLAEPAKDCHASPWIVKTGVSSGSHGAVQGRIDRSPPILPAHFHRKPAIRQSPAPSLASRLLDMDEMSGDCSGNEERTPFVGSGTPVLKVLDRGGSSALDSGALQLQRNDKDCGHESTGSRGQRESNCSGKLEGSFDDNDEDLARQVAARMRRHRERRARTKKLA